ncbi:MAG TPA: vWA domain-containing protein [Methylocella sp.]|nr:vWA domain-containing protein [Methylocella sp.]
MKGVYLKDSRFLLLAAAAVLLLLSILMPTLATERKTYELLAVLDITGSMNTRDYVLNEKPMSRLEFAKLALRDLLQKLPCPSHLGLAIFTERQPFLLFEPVNVCADFAPVEAAIAGLDWRMGWEGDSHIAAGLYRAIAMANDLNADVIFITDGQEAPPLPWSGGPPFEGKRGEVDGLIIGAGKYALSPIPKFDDNGREVGFYAAEDVPHESRFGLPPPGAENREGYNPRNAPFGSTMVLGTEHLSSVREPYLKELANITGLTYRHLASVPDLAAAIGEAATPRPQAGHLDLRPWFIAAALSCLACLYLAFPIAERWFSLHERRLLYLSTLKRRLP